MLSNEAMLRHGAMLSKTNSIGEATKTKKEVWRSLVRGKKKMQRPEREGIRVAAVMCYYMGIFPRPSVRTNRPKSSASYPMPPATPHPSSAHFQHDRRLVLPTS